MVDDNPSSLSSDKIAGELEREGSRVARLIWDNDIALQTLKDPRRPEFANSLIDELAHALAAAPGVLQQVMRGAASAAEDLNVEPFQGLIEVIQNADDLSASEVRFALRSDHNRQQLLVVHNGSPVTCQHVLPMTLPYLTTKTEDANQKGRFGIGLKTLKRISSGLAVHCHPYHFKAEGLSINRADSELPLPPFYDALNDTLIVLELLPGFDVEAFKEWFDRWDEEGLLFLNTIRRFRWCEISGKTLAEKAVSSTDWQGSGFEAVTDAVGEVRCRNVIGRDCNWTVFTTAIRIPAELERAHKAKLDVTSISIAMAEKPAKSGLFVAFKTRIPTDLTFALDAQFDPSTAREALIQNTWNSWLIERCGDLILTVATGLLNTEPATAWRAIPLKTDCVGAMIDQWPRSAFSHVFSRVRRALGKNARLSIAGSGIQISDVAYEDELLAGLLECADIELLCPGKTALPLEARDEGQRWRQVLEQLGVSQAVATGELLKGFSESLFDMKPPAWWVDAANRVTKHHPHEEQIFGIPCWLSEDCRPIPCQAKESTARRLVFAGASSAFSSKWGLLDSLHVAYGTPRGQPALDWLRGKAAFSEMPNTAIELAAFAEAYERKPIEASSEDLRELRDRFDALGASNVERLGRRVGKALLLDGFAYQGGKKINKKVSPSVAYLPRTLDKEHPYWPEAAGEVAGIDWVSPRYLDKLSIGTTREIRRRSDGAVARGPRKFLMLLGAECAPRIVTVGGHVESGPTRTMQLGAAVAEYTNLDYSSPDLDRVLDALPRLSKQERKSQSPALMKTLSHNWRRMYAGRTEVMAVHRAVKYEYDKNMVIASWLCRLREKAWVAVASGDCVEPGKAVIKSAQTQALYSSSEFAFGLDGKDVVPELAAALNLVTEIRVSDLVAHLQKVRDGGEPDNMANALAVYRNLARFCTDIHWYSRVGDLRASDLRKRFSEGPGLICIAPGIWKRATEVFSGKDIFCQPDRFVPRGEAYRDLWSALDIPKPGLRDCIQFCRSLLPQSPSTVVARLIDVYRHMEAIEPPVERRQMKRFPLASFEEWVSSRPVYFVDDQDLRVALSGALPGEHFWTPPCDVRGLPKLMNALDVVVLTPTLTVSGDLQQPQCLGEAMRVRFQRGVDYLSNELARNSASIRERLSMTWDEFREIPLFIHEKPFAVVVNEPQLDRRDINIRMKALLCREPRSLHLVQDAIAQRDYGGRVLASLFPSDVRRSIEAEWVAAWLGSEERYVERMRFASDEEHASALAELARKAQNTPVGKIKISEPASRTAPTRPRLLKRFQGGVVNVAVYAGGLPKKTVDKNPKPLATNSPQLSPPTTSVPLSAPGYTNSDIEQRGWEILTHALNTADAPELSDFRRRRSIGADGAIDWKIFVEMKATGRSPQSAIEMSTPEYDRAQERGIDFILALVSGLEEGETTEVRLILDPAHRATVRPIRGVRLVNLADVPAVILRFDNDQPGEK